MNNVKDQLANVLEGQHSFSVKSEHAVFQKIEQGRRKKNIRSGQLFLIAAAIFVFAFSAKWIVEQLTPTPQVDLMTASFLTQYEVKEEDIIYAHANYQESAYGIIVHKISYSPHIVVVTIMQGRDEFESLTQITYNTSVTGEWEVTDLSPFITVGATARQEVDYVLVGEQQVPLITINESTGLFVSINPIPHNRVIVKYNDGTYDTLILDETEQYTVPDLQEGVIMRKGDFTVDYKDISMHSGNSEYTKHPIVIHPSNENLALYDAIYYYDQEGQERVSRIMALPNSTFEVSNGIVVLNGVALINRYGQAHINGEYVYEQYVEQQNLSQNDRELVWGTYFKNTQKLTTKDHEYVVVPDNWGTGPIEKITADRIIGLVVGYDESHLYAEWTADEKKLYEQLKQTKDKSVLATLDPKTIARLYLYANFLLEGDMSYFFYTTSSDYIMWTEEEEVINLDILVDENVEVGKEYYQRIGTLISNYYQLAVGIRYGEFIQLNETSGYIETKLEGHQMGFQLIYTNDRWEVAFMPIQ